MSALSVHVPAEVNATTPVVALIVQPAVPAVAANVTTPVPDPPDTAAVTVSPHTAADVDVNASAACAAFAMVNDRDTPVAAEYRPSPACAATIVHEPAPTSDTTAFVAPFDSEASPATVHTVGVEDEKASTRSLDVVPAIENGLSPYVTVLVDDGNVKLIVWAAVVISNDWVTSVATA